MLLLEALQSVGGAGWDDTLLSIPPDEDVILGLLIWAQCSNRRRSVRASGIVNKCLDDNNQRLFS